MTYKRKAAKTAKRYRQEDVIDFGEWTIPTSWKEVTLKQMQDIRRLGENPTTEDVVAVLSGKTREEVKALPIDFYDTLMIHLEFLKELPRQNPKDNIVIKNEVYKINYKEQLKVGEWVATQTILQQDEHNLAGILGILCRKPGEVFDDAFENTVLPARQKMFEGLPVTSVLSVIAFFLHLQMHSEKTLTSYSQALQLNISQLILQLKQSAKRGGGLRNYMTRQRTLRRLKKLNRDLQSIG